MVYLFEILEKYIDQYINSLNKKHDEEKIKHIKKILHDFSSYYLRNYDNNEKKNIITKEILSDFLLFHVPIFFQIYSKNKIISIQEELKKYISFLIDQKIINKDIGINILNNFYTKSELRNILNNTNIINEIRQNKYSINDITQDLLENINLFDLNFGDDNEDDEEDDEDFEIEEGNLNYHLQTLIRNKLLDLRENKEYMKLSTPQNLEQRLINRDLVKKLDLKKLIDYLKSLFNQTNTDELIKFIEEFKDNFAEYYEKSEKKHLVEKIEELYLDGNLNKALSLTNKFLSKFPNDSIIFYLKAKIYFDLKLYQNAFINLLKSIEIEPKPIEKIFDLCNLLDLNGFHYANIMISSLLLQLIPKDFDLSIHLAYSCYCLGKPFEIFIEWASGLDICRLAEFLEDYWPDFIIEPRDNLEYWNITKSEFDKNLQAIQNTITKLKDVCQRNGINPINEKLELYLLELLDSKLLEVFSTNSQNMTNKDLFIYELLKTIFLNAYNFVNIYLLFFYENKKLFYKFSKSIYEYILTLIKKNKIKLENIEEINEKYLNSSSIKIDTKIDEILKELNFENQNFIEDISIMNLNLLKQILKRAIIEKIQDCKECVYGRFWCLKNPNDRAKVI
ncbi:MAG: tetratricopeptide repeat protein [Promethearchaeota archaeon]